MSTEEKTAVGEITLFDPVQRVGVITVRPTTKGGDESQDVFFVATDQDLARLKPGQLVQFVMYKDTADDRWLAKDIEVLSAMA